MLSSVQSHCHDLAKRSLLPPASPLLLPLPPRRPRRSTEAVRVGTRRRTRTRDGAACGPDFADQVNGAAVVVSRSVLHSLYWQV